MTKKPQQNDGELSEQQLDDVAGGQEVRKMETIVVTAKKPANFVAKAPEAEVVQMETIQVTAKRERPDAANTRLAAVDSRKK
jgi:hypothetical protein